MMCDELAAAQNPQCAIATNPIPAINTDESQILNNFTSTTVANPRRPYFGRLIKFNFFKFHK